MLHMSIRGLNSLSDLEVLLIFTEKYFGNTVENRNPTLLEVLHFEEEILRQKILWQEKYEGVVSGWMSSKAEKIKKNINGPEKEKLDDKTDSDNKPGVESGVEQVVPGTEAGAVQAGSDTYSPAVKVAESKGSGEKQSTANGQDKPEVVEKPATAVENSSAAVAEENSTVPTETVTVENHTSAEVKPAE